MNQYIETPRLKLIPCDKGIFENLFSGDKALGDYLNVKVPHKWNQFGYMPFRFAFEKVLKNPDEKLWWIYLAVQIDQNILLGSCGYRGKPDFTGSVEIGYQVSEKFRKQGYAYEMAKALINYAFAHNTVKKVIAHTSPDENPAVKILRRCGFEFAGEHLDPEDGKVWRWELHKP